MVLDVQIFPNILSYLSKQDVKKPAQCFLFPKPMYQQLFIISSVLLLNIFNFWFQLDFIQDWITKFGVCVFPLVLQSSILLKEEFVCWNQAQKFFYKNTQKLSLQTYILPLHTIYLNTDLQWVSPVPHCLKGNSQHELLSLF